MTTDRPNIIVLATDDHGYGDLSCLGARDVRTPNMDRLCNDGARFTDWYANGAVCSPTRAALMTGRYPQRVGVTDVLPASRQSPGMTPGTPTIASLLGEHGYRTYLAGKWHLGVSEQHRPDEFGFDRWFGHLGGCIDYYSHISYWGMAARSPHDPLHDLWRDGEEVWHNGEYMTDLITNQAVEYVREAAQADEPFLLYLAYNAPHYPMHVPPEYIDRFPDLTGSKQIMAAMLAALDDGVGAVMEEVARLGLAENTLTIMTSDNGPSVETRNWLDGTTRSYDGGSAGPFRGHKGSVFEGGIRVPGAAHWPGTIPARQVLDEPMITMDVLPTVLAAADIDASQHDLDGTNLLPHLRGAERPCSRDLFWAHGQQTAVRRGSRKLVLNGAVLNEAAQPADIHLSDLSTDPREHQNLASKYPEEAQDLATAASDWRRRICAS